MNSHPAPLIVSTVYCQLIPQLCFEPFQRVISKMRTGTKHALETTAMGETTSRTAPSILLVLPVQTQQALSLQTMLEWQAHIRRVTQVLCHSTRARLCGLQCHSCFTSASLS